MLASSTVKHDLFGIIYRQLIHCAHLHDGQSLHDPFSPTDLGAVHPPEKADLCENMYISFQVYQDVYVIDLLIVGTKGSCKSALVNGVTLQTTTHISHHPSTHYIGIVVHKEPT